MKKYEIGKINVDNLKHKVNMTIIQNIGEIQDEDKEKIL